jgi:hypothetical protein
MQPSKQSLYLNAVVLNSTSFSQETTSMPNHPQAMQLSVQKVVKPLI